MKIEIKYLDKPDKKESDELSLLWQETFGDSRDYIEAFFSLPSYAGAVVCTADDRIVSCVQLLSLAGTAAGWYGYAVATEKSFRGRGLCAALHAFIAEKCAEEGSVYLLHPASESLCGYYERLGLQRLEGVETVSAGGAACRRTELTAHEYACRRREYFGDFYEWGEDVLALMQSDGMRFIGFDYNGIPCAAAEAGGKIAELCAPRAAACLASDIKTEARIITEHGECAVMGYGEGAARYFNLFLE